MKYLINQNSDYVCRIKTDKLNFECYLIGFLEQEPDLFKFKNGVIIQSFVDESEHFYPWESLNISLEQLNRLLNDIYITWRKIDYQKDKLTYCQVDKIQSNLYEYCVKNAVVAEGVSPTVADIIISKSYESGHSGGYSDIICHIWDNIEFVKQILAAK